MIPGMGEDEYRPAEYWSRRLAGEFTLRGTGHQCYSERYNRWLYRRKRAALAAALRGLPPRPAALDVGSGVGWVVAELLARGASVEGCDIADIAVERLRERFPEATFFQAAVGAAPLPRDDASYDVVTMLDVAYHVVDDALWEAAVADLARVLRPGGRLVVSDGLGADDVVPASHVRFRSRVRWEGAAAANGLSVVRVLPYFRWLSRDQAASRLERLPDGARGAVEYVLEGLVPRRPHMRLAVLEKSG